ncbi:Predicted arabinose efflux permease, MFS family [Noviherbaspirillum humi]|uniref:Predicted arabinose efflux permease, MFS family n=1 Tax=Noviherbaspirillum humi TaxID=1688639 RepID=A0A239E0V4_9BURK|nr:MFS transporter [Noviherbaspirillum humi]SNS38129.1 Predicted arabinose efflux permease, MFS family [Noviherbaspirillum humi]
MPVSPTLLQLILLAIAAHIALAGARITTSLYAISLHASELTIGSLVALFALLPAAFAVAAGRWMDRIGFVKPVTLGCVVMMIGCVLPAAFPSLASGYACAVLTGSGFMVTQVAAQHTVGTMSSLQNRSLNYSWLALGYSISGFTGPVTAGFVIDHLGHRASYLVFLGFAAVTLLLIVIGPLRRLQIHRGERSADAVRRGMFDLLREPRMRGIYFVSTLLSAAWDLFTFVLPIHASRLGFSASTIGLILGCFSIATFSVRLAMPWISRRHGEWQVLVAALLLSVLCYAVFPLMRHVATITAVATLLGLAVGASQPNMLALLHHAAPSGRAAEAVGVRVTIGNACQVLLPLIFGGAGASLGLSPVFWTMGALIGAGVPIAWRNAAQQRKDAP